MRFFTRSAPQFPPLSPDRPFWAIGDVHGRADLLDLLARRMAEEAPGVPAVLVGDLVDRGHDSAGVLRMVSGHPALPQPAHCLMGNHEAMMLGFIDDPADTGPLWLANGGVQTLESFGIVDLDPATTGPVLERARDALVAAMGAPLLAWLRALPLVWRSGNVVAVHAGGNPERPIEDQRTDDLLWGHPLFRRRMRKDGIWVVHGHTIVDDPVMAEGRISIDTGAYATGRLTAVLIRGPEARFVST